MGEYKWFVLIANFTVKQQQIVTMKSTSEREREGELCVCNVQCDSRFVNTPATIPHWNYFWSKLQRQNYAFARWFSFFFCYIRLKDTSQRWENLENMNQKSTFVIFEIAFNTEFKWNALIYSDVSAKCTLHTKGTVYSLLHSKTVYDKINKMNEIFN